MANMSTFTVLSAGTTWKCDMSTKSTRKRTRFICLDCKRDTGRLKEFYYVRLDLWLAAAGSKDGMLCIYCLENRIGRHLVPADFTDATINDPRYSEMSELLLSRISGK